jgi:flagellin
LDTNSRTAYNDEFKVLRDTIAKTVANADFNGTNMIRAGGVSMTGLANISGTNIITVSAQNLSLGGTIVTIATTGSIGSTNNTAANAMLTTVNNSIVNLNKALATMGAQYKAIALHNNFMSKLRDNLDSGIGNLVDADLGRESAKLQSLQSKQQLGVQAASIANQSTSALLGLFR